MKTTHYVRVYREHTDRFEEYVRSLESEFSILSSDFSANGGTVMYSVDMDTEAAMALSLVFPLVGCLNFSKLVESK